LEEEEHAQPMDWALELEEPFADLARTLETLDEGAGPTQPPPPQSSSSNTVTTPFPSSPPPPQSSSSNTVTTPFPSPPPPPPNSPSTMDSNNFHSPGAQSNTPPAPNCGCYDPSSHRNRTCPDLVEVAFGEDRSRKLKWIKTTHKPYKQQDYFDAELHGRPLPDDSEFFISGVYGRPVQMTDCQLCTIAGESRRIPNSPVALRIHMERIHGEY